MGFEQPGGIVMSLHKEAPKVPERSVEEGEYGLNKERLARFEWVLNTHGIIAIDLFKNRLEDAEEFPEDYPKYDKERMNRLLGSLKNHTAESAEFGEVAETIASMLDQKK